MTAAPDLSTEQQATVARFGFDEPAIVGAEQWAADGILNAVPGRMMRLLAENGQSFGYAPDKGWSFTFWRADGSGVNVQPGQWVTRYDDNSVTVTDSEVLS